jgi:hypothetical protein
MGKYWGMNKSPRYTGYGINKSPRHMGYGINKSPRHMGYGINKSPRYMGYGMPPSIAAYLPEAISGTSTVPPDDEQDVRGE